LVLSRKKAKARRRVRHTGNAAVAGSSAKKFGWLVGWLVELDRAGSKDPARFGLFRMA